MHFLVNHNLQWTVGSRPERMAFAGLVKRGCRFVFFEQLPAHNLVQSGAVLLHPVPETDYRRASGHGVGTIGVIGQYRPEKGIDELLEQLKPLAGNFRVLLALPNPSVFRKAARHGDADWLSLRDTSGFDAYLQAIAECDVVVLNHPAEGYEHRASGLVADAAAAHVPVAVRNLPMLSSQVQVPVCIGETFGGLSEIPACIERIVHGLGQNKYRFGEYKDARSGRALAERLAEIVACD
jgi:glycosyltransferase involved in cell wall biosynthesis